MNLTQFLKDVNLEFIKTNESNSTFIFNGMKDNQFLILLVKYQFNETYKTLNINEFLEYKKIFDNQRYYKFQGITQVTGVSKEITLIYPASDVDIQKYGKIKIKKIIETPYIYEKYIYPKIIQQDLTWIHNIFNKKCEVNDILYEDEKFVLLPDMKWDGNIDSIYCLAILKDSALKSIRDLRAEHIPLLEHVNDKTFDIIVQNYGVPQDQFRSYFHYRPSFWHSHIHFNLIDNKISGAIVDISHTVHSVIMNLKINSDYYKIANLEVIERNVIN